MVSPLAAQSQVLLIVIDGMSVAVCRELLSDLLGQDWIPLNRGGRDSLALGGFGNDPFRHGGVADEPPVRPAEAGIVDR